MRELIIRCFRHQVLLRRDRHVHDGSCDRPTRVSKHPHVAQPQDNAPHGHEDVPKGQPPRRESRPVTKKVRKGVGGAEETVYAIRLWDKLRALELLAKHFGLLNQRGTVSTSNDDEILRRLARGRTRAAARVSTA